ncbi:MAG: alginate lyase [Bacteroidia bacterium]|nr:alginate lyase [Bacteroidia bacterium]
MKTFFKLLILFASLLSLESCSMGDPVTKIVQGQIKDEVLKRAENNLTEKPITVTDHQCERSAGGIHDFYSEGDYWWPDSLNPEGPYVRRDGQTNPDNFVAHRHAMIRFSTLVGNLTSAYLLTKDRKYIDAALVHIRAWFIDEETRMSPNLLYAQAIKGITTGRGIGIIDTIHLIEVVQSLLKMEELELLSEEDEEGTKRWITEYLTWLTTHDYGIAEMNAQNNHGTCWVMQAAIFAKYTGNEEVLDLCTDRYKTILLPDQMGTDGSFPRELSRTKPYGYSLFNLDAMATVCRILSTEEDNLWTYTTPDGKNMQKAFDFLLPFVIDKSAWEYKPDVMYWDEWPVAQPFLFFGAIGLKNETYLEVWKTLDHFPENEEVIRNLPIRNPIIWL